MPAALISTAFRVYASLVLPILQVTPPLMPSPERIHLQQPFSLGLSLLLKKVAGGSVWLSPPHPHPGPRATVVGGEPNSCLFCFMSGIMFIVVQNQSTLQSGCMSILQGS